MEAMNVFAAKLLPKQEYFVPGHRACQGCGLALAVRQVMKCLGSKVVACNATGCLEIISSSYPDTAWAVPWIHVAFENVAAVASGCEAGLKAMMRKGLMEKSKITVLASAGDGGTADIGLQALSGALERGHDMIYVCYDNEAYMNTGIQRSSSTPYGASTTTSPAGTDSIGQQTWKKNVVDLAIAHRIPYVATINPSYPFDLVKKVKKAQAVKGPAYLHAYATCPTGWRSSSEDGVLLGRLAVECGLFPMMEVVDGKIRLTVEPKELAPLEGYFSKQGRYRHLLRTEEGREVLAYIQERVRKEYAQLIKRAEFTQSL